jgi:hypothetical protein
MLTSLLAVVPAARLLPVIVGGVESVGVPPVPEEEEPPPHAARAMERAVKRPAVRRRPLGADRRASR